MTKKEAQEGGSATSRRAFLKLAATGAPPVAAVAVTASGQAAEAAEPDLQATKLQDTAQTRAYFDSAKF